VTLSTSGIEKKAANKVSVVYVCLALSCSLFSGIYEHFSHGVYSSFMVWLFLFPLVGGAIPFALIARLNKLHYPGKLSINLFHSGIATLTVGSCLKGILEIYGTSSDYMVVYWIAGTSLVVAGVVAYLFTLHRI
jgi:hypothetical protein